MRTTAMMVAFLVGALAVNGRAADPPAQPPEGWKEFVSPTKAFSVLLPKDGKRSERTREVKYGTSKLKLSLVQQETVDKIEYYAGQVALPVPAGKKIDPNAAIEVFRDAFLKESAGKLVDQSDVKIGKMNGKEFRIEQADGQHATLRLYCAGPRIYQISVTGTKKQVESENAKLFLESFKHQGMVKDDEKKKDKDKDKEPEKKP